ncbi:diguanylate cyclase [Altericroceibacterium spongiae]|uniref:diguanylate cyclase n=1 Tax=Altericroceibacterium spongiae TaxID=2320269 RepID=A0A420EFB1_9SPHN|nr:diguanylate cyclase [Altericroceibacterium spongiae]RKF19350.1 diguanylate cyclase [Altericroceibacterium spongiae]
MKLATITNWAYGTTVALTLLSGTTMLLASHAQEVEEQAVEQRYLLTKATSRLGNDIFELTEHARQYLDTGQANYKIAYQHDFEDLEAVEKRAEAVATAGASRNEVAMLQDAMNWADTLHDEQAAAITAFDSGNEQQARQLLFGAEYERELDRVENLLGRFQDRLDQRIDSQIEDATQISDIWKTMSEITLVLTALMFLCVLYFVFKRRVLSPVVKLSDVVNRLAAQDFAVQPPEIDQIDEIGDMAQAIRIFRENGLERQRLEAERNADSQTRNLISRMTQRMQGCDSLSDLTEVVQRFLPEIAPNRAGRLYILDQTRNAVTEVCNWSSPTMSQPEFAPASCWALRRAMPHRPSGTHIDVPCPHLDIASHPEDIPDTICMPLSSQREMIGLLYFEPLEGEEDNAANARHDVYLRMVAENIALAIGNLRLREKLREMAMMDPLTGLANRRRLDAVLEVELARAARLDEPISCLMTDIDHFKHFNDTFGHEAGDHVLQEVGKLLQHATRDPEMAFRYGGEEFLLLLPGFDSAMALERAEEIRRKVSELHVIHSGQELGSVTISIGLATAPEQCGFNLILRSADNALMDAKNNGRDRVEVALPYDQRNIGQRA